MSMFRLMLFAIVTTILAVSVGFAADAGFRAKLVGDDEVPSVKTKAKGEIKFKVSSYGKELSYKLQVKNLKNATTAHIHRGMKGKNGPPVVTLFNGPKKEGAFSGDLCEGTITAQDLTGELTGKTLDDLLQLIKAGDAYVNVHTDAYPNGEIRGQIR